MLSGYTKEEIDKAKIYYLIPDFLVYELFGVKSNVSSNFMEWYMNSKYTLK